MTDLADARRRAWKTRREKYGPHGHNGYALAGRCGACRRMRDLIVKLHVEGVLSEGQAARAIGEGRVALRIAADEYALL